MADTWNTTETVKQRENFWLKTWSKHSKPTGKQGKLAQNEKQVTNVARFHSKFALFWPKQSNRKQLTNATRNKQIHSILLFRVQSNSLTDFTRNSAQFFSLIHLIIEKQLNLRNFTKFVRVPCAVEQSRRHYSNGWRIGTLEKIRRILRHRITSALSDTWPWTKPSSRLFSTFRGRPWQHIPAVCR